MQKTSSNKDFSLPNQAVILAGGLGTRLRPVTNTIPKPMIQFYGRPFLEYLIEMIRDQGFTRILLLLGYLPQVIQEHFGDGDKFGISIDYSVTAVENNTGARVRAALPLLDATFLLMYCDNYWPMPFARMWESYCASQRPAMVTVYRNSDHYSRDNLRVDDDGVVSLYDKSRSEPGLQGVDIGFLILQRRILDQLPEGNVSFEATLYPKLIANRQLQAFVSDHRYYSVGSFDRLNQTRSFLARRPAVILDRDGVLNEKMPRAQYVRSWRDWRWIPGARDALRRLRRAGYKVIVVTNQAGIARGVMSDSDLNAIHTRMQAEIEEAGGHIDAIYYCPHGWDDGCECRKPNPGMLFQAQKDLHLDLTRVYFLGDDERDEQAARSAGCPFLMVSDQSPLIDHVKRMLAH